MKRLARSTNVCQISDLAVETFSFVKGLMVRYLSKIPYSEVTPQQAAEVLLRLADTGSVDWGDLKNPLGQPGLKAEGRPTFPRGKRRSTR